MIKRNLSRAYKLGVDVGTLALAFLLAWFLRFDWDPPATMVGRIFLVAPYVVAFEYLVLVALGVHRRSWRYVGVQDAALIVASAVVATLALLLARVVFGTLQYPYPYLRHGVVPMGVIAANFLFTVFGLIGSRTLRRLVGEQAEAQRGEARRTGDPVRTMLIGAGQGGVVVARELERRPDIGLVAVGFLDDDPAKLGTAFHGIPVLGGTAQLAALCAEHDAHQVLITMASSPGETIRRIRALCLEAKLPVKIIPGLVDIVGGSVNLSQMRDVAIDDLLRRDPVRLDEEAIARVVRDKVVMVTGAGGSIGSELCRQACRFAPERLVLVERAENSLFAVHRELVATFPGVPVVPVIADVCDSRRMRAVFEQHLPAAVLHAAAHKHVPMMEWNPGEAVKNNVGGSQVVADLAHAHRAETFVLVSTDKAVNPTSVMGATKRVAELYVQSLAGRSETRFVTVRFGNVLGSAGSVVPIFKEQIAAGGPITVTHPEMRRYFMTIPEACQLVLQAGSMGQGGEIFILDMGEPMKIVDLARDLIALSGLEEGRDVEIEFTGIRPGEKLYEELSSERERADKTAHPKIFVGRSPAVEHEAVCVAVGSLLGLVRDGHDGHDGHDADALVEGIRALVPEFTREASADLSSSELRLDAQPPVTDEQLARSAHPNHA